MLQIAKRQNILCSRRQKRSKRREERIRAQAWLSKSRAEQEKKKQLRIKRIQSFIESWIE